ncbi:hypothetical protein ACQCSU_17240 [Pseudarthrobacter sp. O4]|uniref:hypothetical protein n=1 Tax=unclassified Pseudarthrobacter TaxID=2647000 RepID=UPI003CF8B723
MRICCRHWPTSPDPRPRHPRILDAYDQVISGWTLSAEDPDAGYARYFQDGPVATRRELVAVQDRANGRVLL